MAARTLAHRHTSLPHDLGALITRSPMPVQAVGHLDPFLLLAHHGPQQFGPNNAGFPFGAHPHRGFETITFILSGPLAHYDSAGHSSVIEGGGVQWMTAGSGVIHAEVSPAAFMREGGHTEVLQLWLNLPARLKMTPPQYHGLQASDIPVLLLNDDGDMKGERGGENGEIAALKLIAGQFRGVSGPVRSLTNVFMATVHIPATGWAILPAPSGRTIFCYVVAGSGRTGPETGTGDYTRWELLEFTDDGDEIRIRADTDTVLLFGHADPIGEPVVMQGPFVMNTAAEIQQAFVDYRTGMFGDAHALQALVDNRS